MKSLLFFAYCTIFLFASILAITNPALAFDADPACSASTSGTTNTQISNIANINYQLERNERWVSIEVDEALPNDARNLGVNDLTTYHQNSLNLSADQMKQVNDLYAAATGASKAGNAYGHATTLPQALAILGTAKDSLSMNQRLMLQSLLGKFLGAHYSTSTKSNTNYNDLYANDIQNVNANAAGGVCVDIHHILAQMASQLGFQAAGTQTLTWLDARGASGHDIALFRDPVSGHYYSQNYGVIVDTGAKSQQSALDTATKMLDAVSNVSMVDDAHGHIHAFVPANALFVHKLVEDASTATGPAIQARVGNTEQALNAHLNVMGMQVFALTDRYHNGDGVYQFNAVGVAANDDTVVHGSSSSRFEERTKSRIALGVLNANVPSYNTFAANPNSLTITNAFIEANFVGSVRLDSTTGHIEMNLENYGVIGTSRQFHNAYVDVGVDQSILHGSVSAGINRRISLVNNPKSEAPDLRLATAYDDVHVLFSSSKDKRKVYLQIGQDIYLMDGVQNLSAVVIKEAVKANFPTKRVGTFSVDGEVAKDISNPGNNAYYNFNGGSSVRASWSARLNRFMDVGADVSHTDGTRLLPIGPIGTVSPDMADELAHTDGRIKLIVHY